ncbi:MAG: hypothetical protein GY915_00225, partial [bacterium]|nr:hypothetical protein [bacterium]
SENESERNEKGHLPLPAELWMSISKHLTDKQDIFSLACCHRETYFLRGEYGFQYLAKVYKQISKNLSPNDKQYFHSASDRKLFCGDTCKEILCHGFTVLFSRSTLSPKRKKCAQSAFYRLRNYISCKFSHSPSLRKLEELGASSPFYSKHPELFLPISDSDEYVHFDFFPLLKACFKPRVLESSKLRTLLSHLEEEIMNSRTFPKELFLEDIIWGEQDENMSLELKGLVKDFRVLTKNLLCQKGILHREERPYGVLMALKEIPINLSRCKEKVESLIEKIKEKIVKLSLEEHQIKENMKKILLAG